MQTRLREILAHKGDHVYTARPHDMVIDAVQVMNTHRIGALVVVDGVRVVGIFTERDALRRIVGSLRDPSRTRVNEVMTQAVVTARPGMVLSEALRLCTERRFRHLPVVENDRLVGMVSLGDLTRTLLDEHQARITALNDYIWGP